MAKLKLTGIPDDKPVKVTIELPASLHRDLSAYAALLAGVGKEGIAVTKLIAPMLERFMATDRAFAKAKRARVPRETA